MTIDDLKERIQSFAKQSWESFQESGLYHQLSDRFENMTPTQQKLTLVGGALLVLILLFFTPLSYLSTATEELQTFEEKRNLVRTLLRVHRDALQNPNIPQPPQPSSLQGMAEARLRELNLLPEQIKSIETVAPSSQLIPMNMALGALKINLAKLNQRQLVDAGSKLQSISPSVKMVDMGVEANAEDPRYFDVFFRLIVLNIPKFDTPPPQPLDSRPGRNRGRAQAPSGDE